mmetsp:Transcript_45324/g.145328  ORF Transcript_45324/g.145328 Transcript_45324/m.145328 type:complete len:124 (+) Transcript_45324:471-842(+)
MGASKEDAEHMPCRLNRSFRVDYSDSVKLAYGTQCQSLPDNSLELATVEVDPTEHPLESRGLRPESCLFSCKRRFSWMRRSLPNSARAAATKASKSAEALARFSGGELGLEASLDRRNARPGR